MNERCFPIMPSVMTAAAEALIEWARQASRLLLGLALFLMLGGEGMTLVLSNKLPGPWQQREYSIGWTADRSLPKFDHGYVLYVRRVLQDGPQSDTIYLNSIATGDVKYVPFWLAGASTVWVDDVAIAPAHQMVVVGSVLRGRKVVNFMSQVAPSGRVLATVDMGSYEPELVCVEGNGGVWTFGQDWDAERSDISYSMLRNYSMQGRLINSYLDNDSLPPVKLNFSTRLHGLAAAPGRVFLECGTGSVGAYLGAARQWVEVTLADTQLRSWTVKLPSSGHVTGLALLGAHRVYGSFRAEGRSTLYVRGIFTLNLSQPKDATWEPVAGTLSFVTGPLNPPPVVVAGSDGQSLVYARWQSQAVNNAGTLFWVRP